MQLIKYMKDLKTEWIEADGEDLRNMGDDEVASVLQGFTSYIENRRTKKHDVQEYELQFLITQFAKLAPIDDRTDAMQTLHDCVDYVEQHSTQARFLIPIISEMCDLYPDDGAEIDHPYIEGEWVEIYITNIEWKKEAERVGGATTSSTANVQTNSNV